METAFLIKLTTETQMYCFLLRTISAKDKLPAILKILLNCFRRKQDTNHNTSLKNKSNIWNLKSYMDL